MATMTKFEVIRMVNEHRKRIRDGMMVSGWHTEETACAILKALAENTQFDSTYLDNMDALASCLILLTQLARLTRYKRAGLTTLNVPEELMCKLDQILAKRGIFKPVEDDCHD